MFESYYWTDCLLCTPMALLFLAFTSSLCSFSFCVVSSLIRSSFSSERVLISFLSFSISALYCVDFSWRVLFALWIFNAFYTSSYILRQSSRNPAIIRSWSCPCSTPLLEFDWFERIWACNWAISYAWYSLCSCICSLSCWFSSCSLSSWSGTITDTWLLTIASRLSFRDCFFALLCVWRVRASSLRCILSFTISASFSVTFMWRSYINLRIFCISSFMLPIVFCKSSIFSPCCCMFSVW